MNYEDVKAGIRQEKSLSHKMVQEMDLEPDSLIDAGIGKIWFKTDNQQLEQIMDKLSEAIEKYGSLKVLEMLQAIYT